MSIKDIMVVCDAGDTNDFRIETTLLLAKVFNAHVIGVYLTPYPMPQESSTGFVKVIDYLSSDQIEQAKIIAESLKTKFETKASDLNIPYEWNYSDGIDVQFIIENARYADLVVLPQGYSEFGEENLQRIDDYLSINLGRPTIITPI
jgi:hypothetical protein